MRNLHIIMPMAGEGSRFKQVGINTPKPLIKANGVPFFVRALSSVKDSFDLSEVKVTCIIQEKHDTDHTLSNGIIHELPFANIITLPKVTNGAVETCLSALPFLIEDNDAILIMDCDLEWHCYNYTKSIKCLLEDDCNTVGGMLLSFNSDNPRYSYALADGNIVKETAEKKVISNNALVGAYFFNTTEDFLFAADKLMSENKLSDVKEYYVSLLYNYLIKDGRTVILHKVDSLYSFGTPEELYEYEHKSIHN